MDQGQAAWWQQSLDFSDKISCSFHSPTFRILLWCPNACLWLIQVSCGSFGEKLAFTFWIRFDLIVTIVPIYKWVNWGSLNSRSLTIKTLSLDWKQFFCFMVWWPHNSILLILSNRSTLLCYMFREAKYCLIHGEKWMTTWTFFP